jgi:hypothetical protein
LITAIVIVVAVVVVVLIVLKPRFASSFKTRSKGSITLEQKLAILADCGLKLSDPFTIDDLLSSWDRSDFEEQGYELTLVGLGMTEEQEPWRYHCVNLWHFDSECIENEGDYKKIAERMSEMAQGSLPLENIQDHVDFEDGEAWLSFSFRGQEIKIDCKFEDDWVDTSIFGRFVQLLEQSDPSKIYIFYDLRGQDCIIGCVNKEELKRLNSNGIKFVPL